MFRATFLGHHGWVYETEDARILVDPLFEDRFGFTDSVELRVYPPRSVDLNSFPPIDAVFLTHEHEGHFDIASLNHLDRRIPVYISSRSSIAMRQFFEEMGFKLHLTFPGVPVEIGDLEFFPVTGDQVHHGFIEEWDVLPYLVRDLDEDGSLFTNVDLYPIDSMWKSARERIDRPGLWAYTNNESGWHFTYSWVKPNRNKVKDLVKQIVDYHSRLGDKWEAPEASLVIGGGFSFGGRQEWVNTNVFPIDHFGVEGVLSGLFPDDRFNTPVPGQTFEMSEGKLAAVDDKCPFVMALPRERWPSRKFIADVDWMESYEPACGRKDFSDGDLDALEEELAGLARNLYAKDQFRRLHSLTKEELEGRKPTIVLALLADEDGGAYFYEYVPQACNFVQIQTKDPAGDYLAVYECWATDLLAFLRCEISSTSLSFGHSRSSCANHRSFAFSFNHPLFEYVHPLRMPDRALEFYRRVLDRQAEPGGKVPFRE